MHCPLNLCLTLLALTKLGADISVEPLAEPGAPTGRFTRMSVEAAGSAPDYHYPKEVPFALMTDPYSGNGVCIGDVDAHGLPDLSLTHDNQENLDGDGDLDLHVYVLVCPNLLYQNARQSDGTFEAPSESTGVIVPRNATALAMADWNREGRADWLVGQNDGPVLVFQRRKVGVATVMVALLASSIAGTQVQAPSTTGVTQTVELQQGDRYLSRSASLLNFGGLTKGANVPIHWPNERTTDGEITASLNTFTAPQS